MRGNVQSVQDFIVLKSATLVTSILTKSNLEIGPREGFTVCPAHNTISPSAPKTGGRRRAKVKRFSKDES